MNTERETVAHSQQDWWTLLALFAGLVAYPVLYSTDFFGRVLFSVFPELLPKLDTGRVEWWYFAVSNLVFHWIPFGFVAIALWRNRQDWSSIGVDWSWFVRNRAWVFALFALLICVALLAPRLYYDNELPPRSSVGFIGPVSSVERLLMILLAFTAAVTEEVIFRGFALTRLKKWMRSAWVALPITAVSFVFIHGEFRGVGWFANYFVAAIAFGAPFILMKLRRLEIVILIHFFIDAALVFAP